MRRRHALPALCLAVAGASLCTAARADEPERPTRVDVGVYPPPGAQWSLALVGLGVTSAWYGAALGFSYAWPDAPGAEALRIPVAGPWMALADTGCADDDPDCSTFTVVLRAILTTMDAVGQTGGVLVAAEALFLPTQDPAASPGKRPLPRRPREAGFSVRPAPYVDGKDGLGLGLIGRF